MLDIQYIRDNHQKVRQAAEQKNLTVAVDRLLSLDEQRRQLLPAIEKLRQQRHETAAQMKSGQPSPDLIAEGKRLKQALSQHEAELEPLNTQFEELMLSLPNIPAPDVPVGSSEADNVVVDQAGKKPTFSFKPKNHWQIAHAKGWIDKQRAAKVAGSRFAYLKGDLVKLQFAIVQYVMSRLTDETYITNVVDDNQLKVSTKPFTPVIPPMLVNTAAYQAAARLDAKEVTYKLADDDLWLNASAEHSLCNMYMNEVLSAEELPIRYLGYATSFRREAGSYGKDLEGILRMHQFDKLEMESFSTPETGLAEHALLVALQRRLMDELGLPYQVVEKCTADIGFPNAKGVDINTWLPGQGQYRETHSADYMSDFQARRLKTRVKINGKMQFVHTNDATALVLSRIPVAIIENFQQADGSVAIPKVLQPFLHGQTTI